MADDGAPGRLDRAVAGVWAAFLAAAACALVLAVAARDPVGGTGAVLLGALRLGAVLVPAALLVTVPAGTGALGCLAFGTCCGATVVALAAGGAWPAVALPGAPGPAGGALLVAALLLAVGPLALATLAGPARQAGARTALPVAAALLVLPLVAPPVVARALPPPARLGDTVEAGGGSVRVDAVVRVDPRHHGLRVTVSGLPDAALTVLDARGAQLPVRATAADAGTRTRAVVLRVTHAEDDVPAWLALPDGTRIALTPGPVVTHHP